MKAATTLLLALFAAFTSPTAAASYLRKLPQTENTGGDGGINGSFSGCFSGRASVDVLGRGQVEMKTLQVGDRILTTKGTYEPVYAFAHYDATGTAKFLQIQTTGNMLPLELTGEHLVYVQGKKNPVRADSIHVGDSLQGLESVAAVTNIDIVERSGLYAPLTASGNVMVDGIKASNYVSLQDNGVEYGMLQGGISSPLSHHNAVHMYMAGLRMLCSGFSSDYCESYNEDGYHHYIAIGIQVMKFCDSLNIVLQIVALAAFFSLVGSIVVVESIFGSAAAPAVMVGAAGFYALVRATRISVRAKKVKNL